MIMTAPTITSAASPCLLLTGGNGFLGEATIRQWGNRGKIFVLVRDGQVESAAERFKPVADQLKDDGVEVDYDVLSCNLLDADLGLKGTSLVQVLSKVTHVINCASNVQFDLTPEDAIENNVKTSICVARFASRCKLLKSQKGGRLVHISTAYVSPPHPNGGLELPTSEMAMKLGFEATKEHHHNTYTWSKCIAEHEVMAIARESNISLSIVRPSIIGPAWSSPFPGWCPGRSSPSQMALMMYTSGILRVVDACGAINIIPVDWVAKMVIDALTRDDEKDGTFYSATVPSSHAAPIGQAMMKDNEYHGYVEHAEMASNARPDFQYRAMRTAPAKGWWGKVLEFVYEDSHAIMLQAIGQGKAANLFSAAIKARDAVIKPYASSTYEFKPEGEQLNLWPKEPSEFFDGYLQHCIDSCQSSMRKYRRPRPGNWVSLLVSFSFLALVATSYWLASKGVAFMVHAYKEELSSFDYSEGAAFFHWSPFGGMCGGRPFGPWTAAALALATPSLYAFVLWATTKVRPNPPSPTMPKWRFLHNVVMTIFSGWVVLATLLEMYRARDTDETLVCMNINTRQYDLIQAAWLASKAYEWIDTIFLLLQHKRPILLHLWHHCSTVVFFGLASPYDFASKWGILFNGTIHFFMYAHYARPFPRWLRPYITRFQILQFVSAMLLAIQASRTCGMKKRFSEVCFHAVVGSYLVLFVHFYVTDKKRRQNRKKKPLAQGAENVQVLLKPKMA